MRRSVQARCHLMAKVPFRSTIQIGQSVARRRKGELYPLVPMLEPTLAHNIACSGSLARVRHALRRLEQAAV